MEPLQVTSLSTVSATGSTFSSKTESLANIDKGKRHFGNALNTLGLEWPRLKMEVKS